MCVITLHFAYLVKFTSVRTMSSAYYYHYILAKQVVIQLIHVLFAVIPTRTAKQLLQDISTVNGKYMKKQILLLNIVRHANAVTTNQRLPLR